MNKVVFLDRDGTINDNKQGYISSAEDFELYPFAAKSIKLLNDLGFLVFVVTNQSGIARGYYSLDDLDAIHTKMNNELGKEDAKIDEIYFSPYHIEGKVEPYNITHNDRKPELGMFKKALAKHDFRIKKSFMVGDNYSDIAFGKKAGLITILVRTGYGEKIFMENRAEWEYKPDYIVKDLWAAAQLIEELKIEI